MAVDLGRLDIAANILANDPTQAQMRFGTGLTLLHDSARVGDTRRDAIDLLIKHGADVNAVTNWDATPLHLAAFHGHVHAASRLLDNGANPQLKDDYGLTPLAMAQTKGHSQCADLIQQRMNDSGQDETPGVFTVNAIAETLQTAIEAPVVGSDEQMSAIDAFYNSFGQIDQNDLHPMDDLESLLRKRRL